MFYKWQDEAIKTISGNSGIISAPTGSGKTLVSYVWSGLVDIYGSVTKPSCRVIFTAPIKALSNERYLELKSMGLDAGLETGDFKKNENAPVLCCTQEIYTLKYAALPGQKVVIDEFHYIFNDSERSRAYIDGLRKTSPKSDILVMSATFGDPEKIKNYLEKTALRNFALYETDERVTELVFKRKGTRFRFIKNALVFVFSKKGAEYLASEISKTRRFRPEAKKRLREIASILEVGRIPECMMRGVGTYYGSMLPKEKLLVEMAFRERILDVVIGTDALSLGVNLPAETVVFGQMAKFIDGPLTKNEFLQMAGRAGRKGFFNTGYVTYIPHSKCENYDYDTASLYFETVEKPCESARISVHPSVGRLLKQEVDVETEAKVMGMYSLPERSYHDSIIEIQDLLHSIKQSLGTIRDQKFRKQVRKVLADIWNDEMEVYANIAVACLFARTKSPDAMEVAGILRNTERNYLQALLKVKRMQNRLPEGYSLSGMHKVDAKVNFIDSSVFGFEEKIEKIKNSGSLSDEDGEEE